MLTIIIFMSDSDGEPEVVVFGQNQVVIGAKVRGISGAFRIKQNSQQNNNKQNKQSITKAMNDNDNDHDKTSHDMTVSRNAVVELDG